VSYILDALTKAAQQRDRRVPVVQRLLAPATRVPKVAWSRSVSGLFVALALNAGLLTVLLVWWLSSSSIEPPRGAVESTRPATPEPARAIAEPPRPTIVEPSRVAEPTRPTVAEPSARAAARAERLAAATRSVPPVPPSAAPPAPVASPPPPVPVPAPQRVAPPPVASAPFTPVTPALPTSPGRTALKLEALIYSDVPSQRMVFINGRRYVEGDLVDGRLRVEEIHEDGVDLSEQGRRTTLRAAH
jgi:hypothetical protein